MAKKNKRSKKYRHPARNKRPVEKTVDEMLQPIVDMEIDLACVDTNTKIKYAPARDHVNSRSVMPEKQLFEFAEYKSADAERIGYSEYSYWKSVWQNFLKKRSAVVMFIVFALLMCFTFVALSPLFTPFDATQRFRYINTEKAFLTPFTRDTVDIPVVDSEGKQVMENGKKVVTTTEVTYWFGTDSQGVDYWCQVWYATRTSVVLALAVSLGEILLGVIIGLIWGYVRALDRFFTELYNFINNIPVIIYMTLIALMLSKSIVVIGGALIAVSWLGTARNIRNLVFMYRDREYNLASRCLGTPLKRILWKNIFPYLVSVIILRLALAIPSTIAYETTLTYLGLMDISNPSLGILLRDATASFMRYPHILVFPAAIVSIITITFYLVGNAFSDACDPRNHV